MFTAFLPAISKDALKRMSEELRSWRIHLRTAMDLGDLRRVDQSRRKRLDELLVRHEALLLRMEVKDRPSPRCRSSGVKLEAA